MADAIRVLSMDAVHNAKSGHQGMPMGMADVATVLWSKFMKYDAAAPDWADRDRFVLSAGHGSMLLYSLLHLTGFKAVTMEEVKNFRQWGSTTAGHPEYGHTPGVETTTGPLGQGIATAVGMAMAERHLAARFGDDLVDHRTWVIAGDGCLMEGVSQEAISMAGRFRLNKLTVLFDDNNTTIDGEATISETGDQMARFKAAGWAVKAIDGHDYGKIAGALRWAMRQDKPTMIACKTKISKGAGRKEGDPHSHGYTLFDDEIADARQAMGWSSEPFVIPDEVYKPWRAAGRKGRKARKTWEQKLAAAPLGAEFKRAMAGDLPENAFERLDAYLAELPAAKPANATRVHSGSALEQLVPAVPEMVGGSADLTGSNNTFVKGTPAFDAPDYAGRYVHYGIREHGMAAAMNGMALHGGVIPYSGTFLVFSDYSRPAIRLGALMGVRVIHVMTHDSIGLGEDGPTHQPIEQIANLRMTPNLSTWRPCDTVETAVAWKHAVKRDDGPTALIFSRQGLPCMDRDDAVLANVAKGGYTLLQTGDGQPEAIIIATGSEVELAVQAAEALGTAGKNVRVVSMPSVDAFLSQSSDYQEAVLPAAVRARVAVEAGITDYWYRFTGLDGKIVGMTGFGASAPAGDLYKHFNITAEAVQAAVESVI